MVADIYFGGLRAFADETNPYRFQLAAHAFRELIAHCPRLTGGEVVFGDGMKQRLVPVKNDRERHSAGGSNRDSAYPLDRARVHVS